MTSDTTPVPPPAAEVGALATTYNLRYVAARITTQHAGDEAVVTYVADVRRPSAVVTAAANIS